MPEPTEPKKEAPTHAEYEAAKALLKTYEAKSLELTEQLNEAEAELIANETKYLEETSYMGNLVKGFDGFLRTGSSERKRKVEVPDSDRLFTRSSVYLQTKMRYAAYVLKLTNTDKSDDVMSTDSSTEEDSSTTITDSYNSGSSPQRKKKDLKKSNRYIPDSDDDDLDV
ncbi:hypothetical protein G9A89_002615 [Geosiphon pyriformis]|nr:hypothetical protein G9A89_002615 [Geosiphon pyriformis]